MNTLTKSIPKITHGFFAMALFTTVFVAACVTQQGCGSTCKRLAEDKENFFSRPATNNDPHIEVTIPFATADALVNQQLSNLHPVHLNIPGLGPLGAYFGKLSIAPKKISLAAATENQVKFRLHFDVLNNNNTIFSMSVDTVVAPAIDLTTGKINIGFGPDALKSVKPVFPKDAKQKLGGLIYNRIPGVARAFLSRSKVDNAAGKALTLLGSKFFEISKDKLLANLGKLSQISIALPKIPAKDVILRSYSESGGGLRLLFVTQLPVSRGIELVKGAPQGISAELIGIRMSGSAMAELANWAIKNELVPTRFNKSGKADKDGEFTPGLDWVPGLRPMKIYLWQLSKPCKRISLGAEANLTVENDQLKLLAKNGKIEDISASSFTKAGIWFYAIWKDAIKINKSAKSEMKFIVGGTKMVTKVENAAIEDNELKLGLRLSPDFNP